MATKKIFVLIMLTGATIFSGCSAGIRTSPGTGAASPTPIMKFPSEKFEAAWREQYDKSLVKLEYNQKRWAGNSIANYDFVVGKMMGGHTSPWNQSPVVIKVRDGQKISIELESQSDKTDMARTDGFEEIDTIDKMFDYMRRELDGGKMLEVEYDEQLSYPKSVALIYDTHVHGSRHIKITKLEKSQ